MFTFIFALLGKDLFAGQMGSPPPRSNFDTTQQALVTVFALFTGEDWDSVMANALMSGSSRVTVYIYFITVYSIGNYMLLAMCVAVVSAGWSATKQLEKSSSKHLNKVHCEAFTNPLKVAHQQFTSKLHELVSVNMLGFSTKSVLALIQMNEVLHEFMLGVEYATPSLPCTMSHHACDDVWPTSSASAAVRT